MKAYTTYIFDLDGTITDTVAVWLGLLHNNLLEFGVTPPDDKTLSQYTHDFKEMVKLGLPEDQIEAFTERAYVLANQLLPDATLHTGAYEMLESLKARGKHIAIFSTMDRLLFEPAMEHQNLHAVTEVAIAGTDVPYRKPHPAGIHKALKDLGVSKDAYSNAFYIGDKDTDIMAAHNAGIDSILYYPPAHHHIYDLKELTKHNPTYVITDWKELLP